jgi:pilus assembly protein CpaB
MLVVLVLAIGSGLLAGLGAIRYLEDRPVSLMAAERIDTEGVVVAARDMGLGDVIRTEDLQTVEWPVGSVPVGYATSEADIVGRSLIADVSTNEPIMASKLADTGLHGLIPLIPRGMRALSVRVDDVVGVAGFVTPQTRVDVILIMTPPGGGEPIGKVILQNVQALAAGQQIQQSAEGQPVSVTVVTVLVDPEEAEKLALAASQGRIQMALRNTIDLDTIRTTGMYASRLFLDTGPAPGGGAPRAARVARPESIIEMYRGGARTLITYR